MSKSVKFIFASLFLASIVFADAVAPKLLVNTLNLSEKSSTPSNPAANTYSLYPKNDGSLYILNSSGVENLVGAPAAGEIKLEAAHLFNYWGITAPSLVWVEGASLANGGLIGTADASSDAVKTRDIEILTGDQTFGTSSLPTGTIETRSGDNSGSGNTGPIYLTTGNATSGGSGGLFFTTGSGPTASGDMSFSTGASVGARGSAVFNVKDFVLGASDLVLPVGTADPTPYSAGASYWNTSTNLFKIYTGSAWKSFVDTNSTQTLSGKTINGASNTVQNIGYSSLNLTGSIVNADVSSSAAIARSKIASGTNNHVVINDGSGNLSSEAQLATSRGGTNLSSYVLGDTLYSSATNVLSALAGNITTTKKFLSQTGNGSVSAAPAWSTIVGSDLPNPSSSTLGGVQSAAAVTHQWINAISTSGVPALSQPACADLSNAAASCATDATNASNIGTGTLAVARGGTGIGSGTSGGILGFTASGTIASSGALTANQLIIGGGAGVTPSTLAAGSQYQVLRMGATTPAYGSVNLDQSAAVTGTLPFGNGGTGQASYADGQLLIGNTSTGGLSKATLSAGSNITITNGNGTIQIAASSSAIPAWTYVSQSSTLNPAVVGDYYLLSGASFTITLPTAASVAGQGIIFQHNGTSLTQVYTFNTTSSQTINGAEGAVSSGNYALYTAGEVLYLISDGANWRVADHIARTGISACVATTITASAGGAAKGNSGTPPTDCIQWERDGKWMRVYIAYSQTNSTGAANGTGVNELTVPGSQSLDTNYFSAYNTTTSGIGCQDTGGFEGFIMGSWGGASQTIWTAIPYDSTHFKLGGSWAGTAQCWGQAGGSGLAAFATEKMYGWTKLPISGWRP